MTLRHWTINGRFLTRRTTGVQRYAREIVAALDQLVREGHPLTRDLSIEVLVPEGTTALPAFEAIPVRLAKGLSGHAWEQITLPRHARGGILSLCNTGTVFRRKQIVCIHDVNVFMLPDSYSRSFRALYRVLLPVLGRVCRRVATVSHFSARQIARVRVADAHKIVVAPNGHEHALRWNPAPDPAAAAGDTHDTVVVLGSLAPHKNIATLLELAPELSACGLKLAIVGLIDHKVFKSAGLDHGGADTLWLGTLSDEELALLLSRSLCLAFPSLMEGFGLPPIEAMALGCPVVVSDRASLPEVCAEAALYAPALSPGIWYERILALRHSPGLRHEMIRRGRAQAARYSWRSSAEIYLGAMAEMDQKAA